MAKMAYYQILSQSIHLWHLILKNRLERLLPSNLWLRRVIFIIRFFCPWYLQYPVPSPGAGLCTTLAELGPAYIKLGQFLSTRPDLLPEALITELALLQDQAPAFAGEIAVACLQQEFGDIQTYFATFDTKPLASASIAQVHKATLHDGRAVIVKVLRPNIKQALTRDLQTITFLGRVLARLPRYQHLDISAATTELERILFSEINLLQEAANCSQLQRHTRHPHLKIPGIHWSLCREHILVQDYVSAKPLNSAKMHLSTAARAQVVRTGVAVFFQQVFEHGFFYADPHPGNIFISSDLQVSLVDFGIMGTIGPRELHYLTENALALLKREYRQVALLHIESGWVPAHTRIDHFEAAIRGICERMFEKPLRDVSFGHILLHLLQTAQDFEMAILPQLLLLQKTLIGMEGIARDLYPDLDLWQEVQPHFQRWVKKRLSICTTYREIQQKLPYWLEKMPVVPELLYRRLAIPTAVSPPKETQADLSKWPLWLALISLLPALWFEFDHIENWYHTYQPWIISLSSVTIVYYAMTRRRKGKNCE